MRLIEALGKREYILHVEGIYIYNVRRHSVVVFKYVHEVLATLSFQKWSLISFTATKPSHSEA